MRTLARAAASSLAALFVALVLVVSGMAVGGIPDTSLGNTVPGRSSRAAGRDSGPVPVPVPRDARALPARR